MYVCAAHAYAYTLSQVEGTVYSGEKIDIWSCGIILYIMVTGVAPFQAESPEELLELIRYGQYVKPAGIDEGCEEILAMTLQVQQNKRPTAAQLLELEWMQVEIYMRACIYMDIRDAQDAGRDIHVCIYTWIFEMQNFCHSAGSL
jgi:serine/threonine protein kinase